MTQEQDKLNNDMNDKSEDQQEQKEQSRPNETGGFDISGVVKIYDPETKEIFVEVRT